LRITFLGTGTSYGVYLIGLRLGETCRSDDPRDKRWRASVYVETDDGRAPLVDAGPISAPSR
jgi:phosphoribosyl 1,2-cyclic phosphate phosphodiesterase